MFVNDRRDSQFSYSSNIKVTLVKNSIYAIVPGMILLFVGSVSAQTFPQSGTNTCNSSDDFFDDPYLSVWRLAINLNSGQSLDAVLDMSTYKSAKMTLSGTPLVPGVTEHLASVLGGYPLDGGWTSCVGKFQTFALLERNGIPYGNRIGQYVIAASENWTFCPYPYEVFCPNFTYSPPTYTAKGIVRFQDFDMNGNLISTANGTLKGGSINMAIDSTDPFWSQFPQ
jgi:hypothetical protein